MKEKEAAHYETIVKGKIEEGKITAVPNIKNAMRESMEGSPLL